MSRRQWIGGAVAAAQTAAAVPAQTVRLPRKLKLAVLGLEGHIGDVLDALPQLPDVELAGISDADPVLTAQVAKRPGIGSPRRYADHMELLDREKPDIAALCGNHLERPGLIHVCAGRGIDVVSEKPLAITRAGFDQVRKDVADSGIRLTMIISMRFLPEFRALRRIVESGEIGEVVQVSGQKSYKLGPRPDWMKHRASFGGTIPFIGIHLVDLMRFTTGRELIHVASHETRLGHAEIGEMENTAVSLFRLDNGGNAVFHLDYCRPESAVSHGDDRLRIAGTRGVAEYQENIGVTVLAEGKPLRKAELPPAGSFFADWLESLHSGKPSGLPLADIYRANEIVLEARDAADRYTPARYLA